MDYDVLVVCAYNGHHIFRERVLMNIGFLYYDPPLVLDLPEETPDQWWVYGRCLVCLLHMRYGYFVEGRHDEIHYLRACEAVS